MTAPRLDEILGTAGLVWVSEDRRTIRAYQDQAEVLVIHGDFRGWTQDQINTFVLNELSPINHI